MPEEVLENLRKSLGNRAQVDAFGRLDHGDCALVVRSEQVPDSDRVALTKADRELALVAVPATARARKAGAAAPARPRRTCVSGL